MDPTQGTSFFDRLRERKVIRYFVTYLGGGFAFIQFVDWFTTRNFYSPQWTDFFLYLLLLLIPAVFVFLYAAGNPGGFRLTRNQIALSSANVLIAAVIMLSKFTGTTFAATMQNVVVTDESGNATKRNVPTANYTARIAVFPFENLGTAPDVHLNSQMLPMLLCFDINQNNRLYGLEPLYFVDELKQYNYKLGSGVSVSTARKIAEDYYTDFFCLGKFEPGRDSIDVTVQIYTTHDGKLLNEVKNHSSRTSVVDEISAQLIRNVYTEDFKFKLEDYVDLPAAELISTNPDVLEDYARAIYTSQWDNNLSEGIAQLDTALRLDPTCAECYHLQSKLLAGQNRIEEGVQIAQKGLAVIDHLPERQQFRIKSDYLLIGNQTNQAITLLEMWRQLYPQNVEPYSQLIRLYGMLNELEKAKIIGEEAANNHLPGSYLLKLAQFAAAQEEFDKAESYLRRYAETFPEKAQESRALGELYLQQGKFQESLDFFQNLALFKMNDLSIQVGIAKSQAGLGQYQAAQSTFQRALSRANNPNDSVEVLMAWENHQANLGQINSSIAAFEERLTVSNRFLPPIYSLMQYLNVPYMQRYVDAGKEEQLKTKLNEIRKQIGDPTILCGIDINLGFVLVDTMAMGQAMRNCGQAIAATSGEFNSRLLQGFYELIRQDYPSALKSFQVFLEGTKAGPMNLGHYYLEALRGNNQLEEAQKLANAYLEREPMDGKAWVVLGDIYRQLNDRKSAQNAYQKALDLWQQADPNYVPYQTLREKMQSMAI